MFDKVDCRLESDEELALKVADADMSCCQPGCREYV